jgi:hypothetical protein
MADYAALREAEAILDLAASLLAQINAEIAALEKAQRLAEESLVRVEATAASNAAFLGTLGQELRQGRRMQEETSRALSEGARLQTSLWDTALPAAFLDPPALATAALYPAEPFRPAPAPLPDFAMPSREELWQGELAPSPRAELWDILAGDVKTYQDLQEKALAHLAAAERELEQAETKPRRRKRPDRTDREEREHER